MPDVRARGAIAALALVAGFGAAVGARHLVVQRAESELVRRGFSWLDRRDVWDGATWTDLRRTGVMVETLSLDLLPRPSARLDGVDVDVAQVFDSAGAGAGPEGGPAVAGAGAGAGAGLVVEVSGLNVRWGETPLMEGLSGPLSPALSLRGTRCALERTAEGWRGSTTVPLDLSWARGVLEVELQVGQDVGMRATIRALELEHALLATGPLPALAASLDATRASDGTVRGRLRIDALEGALTGTASLSPRALDLKLVLPDTPLEDILASLGSWVPEGRKATLAGTVAATATLQGWPPRWSLTPSAAGLAADGVIGDVAGLRQGPFTWRAPSEHGLTPRSTGEGQKGWTPLDRAGPFAQAVIAAEDARFWTHPGYDLEGIQVAIDAVAAGEERPRGGSTLTQQLAKNLFLDGERTVARKARELLCALELERVLGKKRILELYLNVVELGPDLYGIGPAADAYFLKRPEALSWREAAFLAAILPSPRAWGPEAWAGGRPPNARIEAILSNLVRLGSIDEATAVRARRETLRFVPPAAPPR